MCKVEIPTYIEKAKYIINAFYQDKDSLCYPHPESCLYCPLADNINNVFSIQSCKSINNNYTGWWNKEVDNKIKEYKIEQLKLFVNKYDNKINKLKSLLEEK